MRQHTKIAIAAASAGVAAAGVGVGLGVAHFASHPARPAPMAPFAGRDDYVEVQRDTHLDEICRLPVRPSHQA